MPGSLKTGRFLETEVGKKKEKILKGACYKVDITAYLIAQVILILLSYGLSAVPSLASVAV